MGFVCVSLFGIKIHTRLNSIFLFHLPTASLDCSMGVWVGALNFEGLQFGVEPRSYNMKDGYYFFFQKPNPHQFSKITTTVLPVYKKVSSNQQGEYMSKIYS